MMSVWFDRQEWQNGEDEVVDGKCDADGRATSSATHPNSTTNCDGYLVRKAKFY
jgi:hypothetical protein